MMTSIYEAARRYFAAGFSLIPCTVNKKPAIAEWREYISNRPSSVLVDSWFFYKAHSIGLVLGNVSNNTVVIDLDGTPAVNLFKKQFPALMNTTTVLTGSQNGAHLYFHVDTVGENFNVRVPNIGGFEIRGNGQYVIAPPSWHPSGARYETIREVPPLSLPDLSAVAQWLKDLREQTRAKQSVDVGASRVLPRPTFSNDLSPYMYAVYMGELSRVRSSSEGNRNNTLFYASLRLANFAAGGELSWYRCESALLEAALSTGMEMNEATRTIASAWNIGKHSPKQQPRKRS